MLKKIFILLAMATGMHAEQMSVDEKIGEVLCLNVPVQVNQRKLDEAKSLIEQFHIGTVIIHRRGSYMRAARTINALKEENPSLMVMFDAEWGLSMRLPDALRFPHNMTLGAIQDESLIYELGL
jgi:beta-N-acetylhexosaminidase